MKVVRFIDLFCGIGGFRLAAQNVCSERDMKAVCVFSSDIDSDCQMIYEANLVKDHQVIFARLRLRAFPTMIFYLQVSHVNLLVS